MERNIDAQVLLLAAQVTSTSDLPKLRSLAANHRDVLSPAIIYRLLLTYLPLDNDAETEQHLISFIDDLNDGFSNFSKLDSGLEEDTLHDVDFADPERALSGLRLERVPIYDQEDESLLTDFVIAWVHKIEEFSGLSTRTLALVDHFAVHHPSLHHWANTYMRPLHHLQNDLYLESTAELSLYDVETANGKTGVDAMLQFAIRSGEATNVGRDLEEVVTPWVRGARYSKRRRLDSTAADDEPIKKVADWNDVNQWLLTAAHRDYDTAAAAVEIWNGPVSATRNEVDAQSQQEPYTDDDALQYVRTVLALVYVSQRQDDPMRIAKKQSLLKRAAGLAQLMPPDFDIPSPNILHLNALLNAPRSDLLDSALLSSQNLLTNPSTDIIDFLYGVLSTQTLLAKFKIDTSTRSVVSAVLFDSAEKQKQELRNILNQVPRLTISNVRWPDVRTSLRWLQSWSSLDTSPQTGTGIAYLGRLETDYIDLEILDAILATGDFQSTKEIYLTPDRGVLPLDKIQEHVVAAILSAYDNASNGNRTRGGVKRASDLITAFKSELTDQSEFERLEHLIRATHSLSFYHLTLQHGVPFRPVSIRVSSDPLSLVEKILDQNNKAYTKLDDLLSITRNLVLADLPTSTSSSSTTPSKDVPLDRRLFDAEHRITYAAIVAALSDHDFDTAYSLITTRLSTPSNTPNTPFADDTSWRAAYAAGKHRPNTTPTSIHAQISSLQKRLELLSTALALAPDPTPLPEILSTWRRLEEELDSLKSRALQEERALDAQLGSDALLPGSFGPSDRDLDSDETKRLLEHRRAYNSTGPSYEEEAPMGLFDVAKGAARALGKNAFPLRGAHGQNVYVGDRGSMEGSRTSAEGDRPGSTDGQRVRKRDMLSSAVTGGLMSGMSWVLGAPAVDRQGQQDHDGL